MFIHTHTHTHTHTQIHTHTELILCCQGFCFELFIIITAIQNRYVFSLSVGNCGF